MTVHAMIESLVVALLLVATGCRTSTARQADPVPDAGGWVRLTPDLEARLCVNQPLVAEDQCWYSWVEIRNNSASPMHLGGDMQTLFAPRIEAVETGAAVAPWVASREVDTQYRVCQPGQSVEFAMSVPDYGDAAPYSYLYGGSIWRVEPGRYRLGGRLLCRWRASEDQPFQSAEVQLLPVAVEVWRAIPDDELDAQIGRIRAAHAADPAALWLALGELVQPGMRRAQVERILPMYNGSPAVTMTQGAGQVAYYLLDPQWTVRIPYDYSGSPRDAAGQMLAHDSPANRTTGRPLIYPRKSGSTGGYFFRFPAD